MITQAKSSTFAMSLFVSMSALSGCANTQGNQQGVADVTKSIVKTFSSTLAAGIAGAREGWGEGWGEVMHQSSQVRSAREDQRLYGFSQATNRVLIKLNKGYASPKSISPGKRTTIYSDYSLSLPPSYNNRANVTYQWKLRKEGQVLTQSKPAVLSKTAAGHQTSQPIDIPHNAEYGTYIVETKLSSNGTYDVNEVSFVVR